VTLAANQVLIQFVYLSRPTRWTDFAFAAEALVGQALGRGRAATSAARRG
jgi:hypothetical protein